MYPTREHTTICVTGVVSFVGVLETPRLAYKRVNERNIIAIMFHNSFTTSNIIVYKIEICTYIFYFLLCNKGDKLEKK
jgi:hypothetical protein